MGPGVPDPADQGDQQRGHSPANPDRAEPVIFLALVENNLQCAGPDDQQAEAEVIKGADLGVLDIRRIVDEAGDHENRKNADRDVDVKGIAPTEGIGEPAAEGGAKDGSNHDPKAVRRHGHGALLDGKALEKDGLGERLQGAPSGSLHYSCQQNDSQRRGSSAEEGRDGEDDDADKQESLAAEAARKPVGGREDDRVSHQVAGQHPGCFGVGGREGAGNVGERHRGDGGVKHLHEGGQHHREGDQPRVDALGERVAGLGGGGGHVERNNRD